MGIPGFFLELRKNHPECVKPASFGVALEAEGTPTEVDVLGLDVNAILHPVLQKAVEAHGVYAPWPILCDAVIEELREFVEWVRPSVGVYLAIDGVAGGAKQAQQRKRRFKGAVERRKLIQSSLSSSSSSSSSTSSAEPRIAFDSSAISCGSPFMAFFQYRLKQAVRAWSFSKNITAWISDDAIEGEGEHKLVRFFERHSLENATKAYRYAAVSIDADVLLLMLGLDHVLAQSYVLKQDRMRHDGDPRAYHLVDITRWAQGVHADWDPNPDDHQGRRQCLADFIAVCSWFGNDFVPAIAVAELGFGGYGAVKAAYREAVEAYGPLVRLPGHAFCCEDTGKRRRLGVPTLNRTTAAELTAVLARDEPEVLASRSRGSYIRRDKLLAAHLTVTVSARGIRTASLDWAAYRQAYYRRNFQGLKEDDGLTDFAGGIAEAYMQGIAFTVQYYLCGMPDWQWSYPFHYAPLARDLAQAHHVRTLAHIAPIVSGRGAAAPELALASILPSDSLKWLPFDLDIASIEDDEVRGWFDCESVQVDLEGKRYEYEGIIVLPFVYLERMQQSLSIVRGPPSASYDMYISLLGGEEDTGRGCFFAENLMGDIEIA